MLQHEIISRYLSIFLIINCIIKEVDFIVFVIFTLCFLIMRETINMSRITGQWLLIHKTYRSKSRALVNSIIAFLVFLVALCFRKRTRISRCRSATVTNNSVSCIRYKKESFSWLSCILLFSTYSVLHTTFYSSTCKIFMKL